MSASKVAYELLTATGGSSYAVTAGRVYPDVLPQTFTLPAKVYTVISVVREHAMGTDPGHVHARVQVDDYAATKAGVETGAANTRTDLFRKSGTVASITVDDVFQEAEQDLYEESMEDEDGRVFRISQDFIIHHRE